MGLLLRLFLMVLGFVLMVSIGKDWILPFFRPTYTFLLSETMARTTSLRVVDSSSLKVSGCLFSSLLSE